MPGSLRLFLIEDNDDFAMLIRRSLERMGHAVTRCRTGADALIVLGHAGAADGLPDLRPDSDRLGGYDLVLLDQQLPDMLGIDLLTTLTREGISVPVLVVTAYGDEQLATRVLHAGALDYIVKDPALTFLTDLPKRVTESVTRHRLEHTNRLLVQSLESARDGIFITDLQGVIQHLNHSLELLTGYRRDEMLGQTPRLFRSGIHPEEFYADMWRTILNRSSWQGELSNRRKDGRLCQVSMTISPLVDAHGRLTHFVGIQRDISAQKSLERQLLQAQKMQSVGTLAGGVAHEFNNLLAGINGYASLGLREADLGPTVREFFGHIVALSERAATLTRQLLTFARKPALVRQRTLPLDLLRETAELVRRTLRQEVVLDLPGPAEDAILVDADANQLQQAIVNLTLNARDALLERQALELPGCGDRVPQGPPVTFRLAPVVLTTEQAAFPQRVPPGDYALVQVRDEGIGMAPEVLNQSLDPFFTTKEVGQGTGLGLPMVFGIVQGHQGYLSIDSVPGQGTCVSLWLPRMLEPLAWSGAGASRPGRRGPSPANAVVEHEPEAGRSVLVIDDEEAVLDVVRRFLQIAGHRVTTAITGQEGVALTSASVDLVILDVMMPREDAAVTFRQIRQRRPTVPVLLCTGLAEAQPVPDLLRDGAAGLLRKPFRMNQLWHAVRQALA